jgi:hypothetical protein
MTNNSTLALMAVLTAASVASPAVAQSSLERYGSQLPYYYDASGKQVHGAWAPEASAKADQRPSQPARRQLYLSASREQASATSGANDPALAGGGSLGYNQNLKNY